MKELSDIQQALDLKEKLLLLLEEEPLAFRFTEHTHFFRSFD